MKYAVTSTSTRNQGRIVSDRDCVVRRTFHTMSHMRHPSNRDVGQETKTDFGPQHLKD